MTGDNNFYREWQVQYTDEPQYSGTISISRVGGNTQVSGQISRNGSPDGSYVSTSVNFPNAKRLSLNFVLATGHTGKIDLDLAETMVGGVVVSVSASGNYQDDNGGDTGRLSLTPVFPNPNDAGSNFTYSANITAQQRQTLQQRHVFAYQQIMNCNSLTSQQKDALRIAYTRQIDHDQELRAGVNASAFLGGHQVFVNFGVLFPQGNNEISQTLIHEMMHNAGYGHPDRTAADAPGDNGPYYSTPPLQAELCIAGLQSDSSCTLDANGRCTINN